MWHEPEATETEEVAVPATPEIEARIEAYARVSTQFSLPPLVVHRVGADVRLRFSPVAPLVRLDRLAETELFLLLNLLAALEDALGRDLAYLGLGQLRHDPTRRTLAVTAGLFVEPEPGEPALAAILRQLRAPSDPLPPSVRSAVAALAATRPGFTATANVGSLVRALLDAATAFRGRGDARRAREALRDAWALRPGDAEVGQRWVEVAIELREAVPRDVEDALVVHAPANAGLLRGLTLLAHRRGDRELATARADHLTRLAPLDAIGWKVLAAAAQDAGDAGRFDNAMVGLACTGEAGALRYLHQTSGITRVGPLLETWPHAWDAVSAGLRMRWLAHEERLRELLQFYFTIGDTVRMDVEALEAVVAAADRLPGRLQALRERMRAQLLAAPSVELVRAYVLACERDSVPEAVVAAANRWPEQVPRDALLWALLRLAYFDRVIESAAQPEWAEFRLEALVRGALQAGAVAPEDELRRAVKETGPRSEPVQRLLNDLGRVAPDAAITKQLQRLCAEME